MTSNTTRPLGHLLRILGLAFGLAVVVGGVVGQGILRTPGIVAGAVPDPGLILLLWALGGVLILIDACSMVELGASVPRSGGPYALNRRAFGRIAGIVTGWADWINNILVIAFLSVVFGEFCQSIGIGGGWPIWALSLAMIAGCWAINWTGTRFSGASQTLLSAFKGAALILLVALLFLVAPAGPPPVASATPSTALTGAALVLAMSAIINTYAGWTSAIYFGEELVAPQRNIARATFGGILLVMLLYISVNAALLHVLPPVAMAGSNLPAADAAARLFGSTGKIAITLISLVSVAAIANLYLMFTSRIGFAMARDGVLPRGLAQTSASGTPRQALTLAALLAAVVGASGTYAQIVAATVPLSLAIVASLDLAAIVMRRKEPDLPRPFKMPLFPLPAVAGLLLNLALMGAMMVADPINAAIGIGAALLLGVGYALLGHDKTAAIAEPRS